MKKRKKKKTVIKFNERLSVTTLPGMVECSRQLIELEQNYEARHNYKGGYMVCAAMNCALTSELLLKYKLGQDGVDIPMTHDLFELYEVLSNETKSDIQGRFEEYVSRFPVRLIEDWDNVASIFKSARCAFEIWRYVMQEPTPSAMVSVQHLYAAAWSVFVIINDHAKKGSVR